jgi:hypothetical protein
MSYTSLLHDHSEKIEKVLFALHVKHGFDQYEPKLNSPGMDPPPPNTKFHQNPLSSFLEEM